ncbi:acyl-CoA desaturase, partial [Corynebacterium rouxii]|nr:acyl-CoA desaturase [Corynebacterium rouxii]
EYDLPYNIDSFPVQLFKVQKTLLKLALPNKYLVASPDNAPEVRSNRAFTDNPRIEGQLGVDSSGKRVGLKTGLQLLKRIRPGVRDVIRAYSGRSTRK